MKPQQPESKQQLTHDEILTEYLALVAKRHQVKAAGGDVTEIQKQLDDVQSLLTKSQLAKHQEVEQQREKNVREFNAGLKTHIEQKVSELFIERADDLEFFPDVTKEKVIERCLQLGDSKWTFTRPFLLQWFILDVIAELSNLSESNVGQAFPSFDVRGLKFELIEDNESSSATISFQDYQHEMELDYEIGLYRDPVEFFYRTGVINKGNEQSIALDGFVTVCKAMLSSFFLQCSKARRNKYHFPEHREVINCTYGDAHVIEERFEMLMFDLLKNVHRVHVIEFVREGGEVMNNTTHEQMEQFKQEQIKKNIETFDPEVKAVIERTVHELALADQGPDSFFEAEEISEHDIVQHCLEYGDSKWRFTKGPLLEMFIKELINEKVGWMPYIPFFLHDFKIEEEWLGATGGKVRMFFNDIELTYQYNKHIGRRFSESLGTSGVIGRCDKFHNEPKTIVDKEQFITFCKASIFMFFERCCAHRYETHAGMYMHFTDDQMNPYGDAHIIQDNLRNLMCQLLEMYVAFDWSQTFREEEKNEEVAA